MGESLLKREVRDYLPFTDFSQQKYTRQVQNQQSQSLHLGQGQWGKSDFRIYT